MGVSRKWLRIVRRKFLRSSNKDITLPRNQSEEAILGNEATNTIFTKEDVAAIKIQAYFRGHLARLAYRALKSLVKLQALVRGVCVRKQSRIAMQCVHALVRLQVRVRARQLFVCLRFFSPKNEKTRVTRRQISFFLKLPPH